MKQAILQFARRELWWNLLAMCLLFIALPLALHQSLGIQPLIGLLFFIVLSIIGIRGKYQQNQA